MRKKRIVFITGEQEYGKTYTAFHILWKYYSSENICEPKYIQTRSKEEGDDILERLQRIDKALNHKIIYFEDPFGKIDYESNKKLEDNIGRIMENLKLLDSVYIIITSRDNVFEEFESNNATGIDLKDYRKNLNINSYDDKNRQEMLFKWAAALGCEWMQNDESRDIVTRSIEHLNKLRTSLNITDFVIATIAVNDEQELLKLLDEKSEGTARSFAKEVKDMEKRGEIDKILFLSFPFISDSFSLDFVKGEYQILVKELNLELDEWEFDRILHKFERGGKIDVSNGYVSFSHPSYSEALPFILFDKNGIPTKINTDIFSSVLTRLSDAQDPRVAVAIANVVVSYFDKLPGNVQNLLLKLAEYPAGDVARAVANNFDKLPENVRNELLIKVVHNKYAALYVAHNGAITCFDCKNPLEACMCTCPYCGKIDACKCCLYDAATGGG